MTGHCLSGAGGLECVASLLQLYHGFIFPNINCPDLNPDIVALIGDSSAAQELIHKDISIIAKANFGFGDVNGCVIFKKYKN